MCVYAWWTLQNKVPPVWSSTQILTSVFDLTQQASSKWVSIDTTPVMEEKCQQARDNSSAERTRNLSKLSRLPVFTEKSYCLRLRLCTCSPRAWHDDVFYAFSVSVARRCCCSVANLSLEDLSRQPPYRMLVFIRAASLCWRVVSLKRFLLVRMILTCAWHYRLRSRNNALHILHSSATIISIRAHNITCRMRRKEKDRERKTPILCARYLSGSEIRWSPETRL